MYWRQTQRSDFENSFAERSREKLVSHMDQFWQKNISILLSANQQMHQPMHSDATRNMVTSDTLLWSQDGQCVIFMILL
jgi:hypothetical protein